MRIHYICFRKILFGGLSEKWSKPYSVQNFIKSFPDKTKRDGILKDVENIVFYGSDERPLDYLDAISIYRRDEAASLDSILSNTFSTEGLRPGFE